MPVPSIGAFLLLLLQGETSVLTFDLCTDVSESVRSMVSIRKGVLLSAIENKALIQEIMDARAIRDHQPFLAAMADDFVWRITGSSAWSETYSGKADVQERLLKPLYAQFTAPSSITPTSILADGDYVVVQCHGNATTRSGEPYRNTYCLVIRLENGQLREMTEYMDTALVDRVLEPPPWRHDIESTDHFSGEKKQTCDLHRQVPPSHPE
jgi:uncharacterized protein